jgi:trimeric autotransporter adhesin
MPKEEAMTQISRPFQIGLLAAGLFVAVWFIALRGHSAGGSGSGSAASSTAVPTSTAANSSPAAEAKAAAAPTPIYHGAAPGVEGLTRAINKAHAAVAASQQSAKQTEAESAQASSAAAAAAAAAASATSKPSVVVHSSTVTKGSTTTHKVTIHASTVGATGSHGTTVTKSVTKSTSTPASKPSGTSAKSPPPMQVTVENELKQGKMVAVLFWNPRASVDSAVQRELQVVSHSQGGKLAVHDARAAQVGAFGSITRAIQVYQTPTILIINKNGLTTTLTGLTDAFAIEQAIAEARHA